MIEFDFGGVVVDCFWIGLCCLYVWLGLCVDVF